MMLMGYVWVGMAAVSLLYGAASGNLSAVSAAAMEGAGAAVKLALELAGSMALWSAVMELMRQSGLSKGLALALSPLLRRLFPRSFAQADCAEALSENISANLLGLGNAATPAGIRAVKCMEGLGGCEQDMSRLVVLNTASVQLLPTTVAAIRAAAGSHHAFDILPCVWLSSLVSVTVGLAVHRVLEGRR